MSKALPHLVTCIVLTVVAAVVCPVYFGWPPRLDAVLRGLADPAAWGTLLVVGTACAWVSWRQRRAATVSRAMLWGFVWGLGIGTLGALLGCVVARTTSAPRPSWLADVPGCWAAMSLLIAPYVAIWLAPFCGWQRWRRAA